MLQLIQILVVILLGLTIGAMNYAFVLTAKKGESKTFARYLATVGFAGLGGGVSILASIVAITKLPALFGKLDHQLLTWIYLLSFLVAFQTLFLISFWLFADIVQRNANVPNKMVWAKRCVLLFTFLSKGIVGVKEYLEAMESITKLLRVTTLEPEKIHERLSSKDPEGRKELAEEGFVSLVDLEKIKILLKCTENDIRMFLCAVREVYHSHSV